MLDLDCQQIGLTYFPHQLLSFLLLCETTKNTPETSFFEIKDNELSNTNKQVVLLAQPTLY